MEDKDLRRTHCGSPVLIDVLNSGATSKRKRTMFTCEFCGYQEEEMRAESGSLLWWKCLNVGTRHEKRRAV